MLRLIKGVLLTGLVSFGAFAMSGCEDNETMLFVQSVLALSGDCTAEADPDSMM